MRLSVELIRVGITAWYALSGLIGGKILRACKCGAIPFCAVMLGGFFYGILYVCSCIREQHWIALEGENLTIFDFVYGSGTTGKRAVEKEVRAV